MPPITDHIITLNTTFTKRELIENLEQMDVPDDTPVLFERPDDSGIFATFVEFNNLDAHTNLFDSNTDATFTAIILF
jgi:hypothetical protein